MVIDSLLITTHIIIQMTFDLESTVVLMDMPIWWSNKLYHTLNWSVPYNFIGKQKNIAFQVILPPNMIVLAN